MRACVGQHLRSSNKYGNKEQAKDRLIETERAQQSHGWN